MSHTNAVTRRIATANCSVTNASVLDGGKEIGVDFVVSRNLLDRATDAALTADGYIEESKEWAVRSWVGRFATNELWDAGIHVSGWSVELDRVDGIDDVSTDRPIPFVAHDGLRLGFQVVSPADQLFEVEQRFSNRVLEFLIGKGIVE